MTLQEIYDEPIPDSERIHTFQRHSTLNEDEYKRDKILKFLSDKFSEFENREDWHVSEVHMPPADFKVFSSLQFPAFDPTQQRSTLVETNIFGYLWNAAIKVKKEYKSIELI